MIFVILGSAPNLYDDYNRLRSLIDEQKMIFCVIGLSSTKLWDKHAHYIASYHPKDFIEIKKIREERGLNIDYKIISHENYPVIDNKNKERLQTNIIIPYEKPSGSSALLGTLAGIKEGYKKIVLCGCPLEGVNAKKSSYNVFRKGWLAKKEQVKFFVRSMSGWTQQILGEPTKEWLDN